MSKNQKKNGKTEPLIIRNMTFQELADKVTFQLEAFNKKLDIVDQYSKDLKVKGNERSVKNKAKDEILKINKTINELSDQFRLLNGYKFTNKTEKEYKNKIMKRLRGYFSRQHDRFVELVATFQMSEKVCLEKRRSVFSNGSAHLSALSDVSVHRMAESIGDAEMIESIEDIDFYQVILEERESQIKLIRGIAYELNAAASDQARLLDERQQDLENAVNNASVAEQMIEEGNDEIDQGARRMGTNSRCSNALPACLLFIVLAGVAFVLLLVFGVIKFNK